MSANIGFGVTFPTADFKKSFDPGWNGNFGVTFNINEHVGVQAEYGYTRMNGPDKTISLTATFSDGSSATGIVIVP